MPNETTVGVRSPHAQMEREEKDADMDELQREIQELFSDLWQVPRFSGLRAGFRPHVDCFRTKDALTCSSSCRASIPTRSTSSSPKATLYVVGERDAAARRGAVVPADGARLRAVPPADRARLGRRRREARARRTSSGILKIVLPLAQRAAGAGERVAIEVTRS